MDERLNQLVAMLMRMSVLDFEARAPVGEGDGVLDALATGLNLLSEELAVHMAERAEMEQELRNARDEMELRVKLRTKELEETNLELGREMAERKRMEVELGLTHKLEAIGELAGGIATRSTRRPSTSRTTCGFCERLSTSSTSFARSHAKAALASKKARRPESSFASSTSWSKPRSSSISPAKSPKRSIRPWRAWSRSRRSFGP